VLPHHDRDAVEVHCYSDRARPDRHTRFLRAAADRWTDCAGLDDAALTRRIGADAIDILIDLAGHTGANRLPVFARRPAPVQATWAGYVGTTGLAAMDFLIADRHHVPPGCEGDHAETVIRLPDAYVCYAPPDDAPAVSPPPCLGSGTVTFGSFNNLAKINDQVLALWAALLRNRPMRRLRLQSPALTDPATRARVRGRLGRHGVVPDQIVLEGATAPAAMLAAYGEIDIALDPFPYSGGLTTLEALWMGVPVVTLAGERFCSRHSTAHLTVAGHPELVTHEPAAYLALAEALAEDPDRLCRLRGRLRGDLAASPLCDGIRFTRGLEAAYRTMWDGPFNLS
jgi:predicted O-linked N-acetylglucosamine transferase (SPINDLY family)